jgi:hypothetical protein
MPRRSLLLPTLVAALGLGCADSQAPTGVAAGATAPTFRVEHGTRTFPAAFADERYIVFLQQTVETLSAIICTGAEVQFEELDRLLVTRPDGSTKEQIKGEVSVVVVDLAAFDQFCEDASAVPTYTGTARVVANDSDTDLSGHGADVGRIQVTGTVTDAAGQAYHLTAIAHGVISPTSTLEDQTLLNAFAAIHVTPIGR